MIKESPDFVAVLDYLSTEDGGRSAPALSGYRPGLKFEFTQMQTSGQQIFLDTDIVYPGESVIAEITLASSGFFNGYLSVGMKFDFRESAKIIGTGEILEILNKDLEKGDRQ